MVDKDTSIKQSSNLHFINPNQDLPINNQKRRILFCELDTTNIFLFGGRVYYRDGNSNRLFFCDHYTVPNNKGITKQQDILIKKFLGGNYQNLAFLTTLENITEVARLWGFDDYTNVLSNISQSQKLTTNSFYIWNVTKHNIPTQHYDIYHFLERRGAHSGEILSYIFAIFTGSEVYITDDSFARNIFCKNYNVIRRLSKREPPLLFSTKQFNKSPFLRLRTSHPCL